MSKNETSKLFFLILSFGVLAPLCALVLVPTYLSQCVMIALIMILSLITAVMVYFKKRKDPYNGIIFLIIGVGVIMRVGYCAYTGIERRTHDLYELSPDAFGHASYILKLMTEGKLPDTINGQFYQQPFFYILGAGISKVVNLILGRHDYYSFVKMTRIVTCASSCAIMLVADSMFKELKLTSKQRILGNLLVSFTPAFFLAGGCIGVDSLTALFMSLQILFSIKWYRNPTWKNTIILAFAYGFGVMTKISCAVIAIITAPLFIKRYIGARAKKEVQNNIFYRLIVFGLISLPLGLWATVIRYLTYGPVALRVPQSLGQDLSVKGYSLAERFLFLDLETLLMKPYLCYFHEKNAHTMFLKTSMFGETVINAPLWIEWILLLFGIFVMIIAVTAIIWQLTARRKERAFFFLALVVVIYYAFMMAFYYQYPARCSPNFRYMLVTVVPVAAIIGNMTKSKNRVVSYMVNVAIYGYSVFSCILYLLIY